MPDGYKISRKDRVCLGIRARQKMNNHAPRVFDSVYNGHFVIIPLGGTSGVAIWLRCSFSASQSISPIYSLEC